MAATDATSGADTASKNQLPIFIVDAFTDQPFSGNPAAVCLIDENSEISSATMLKIAAEMNLSETAFLRLTSSGDTFKTGTRFGIRWFTPTVEELLCGHATLASAAVLFRCVGNQSDVITFDTVHFGQLKAVRDGDYISLDLPTNDSVPLSAAEEHELDALIKTVGGDLKVEDVRFSAAIDYLLIRLDDSLTLQDLQSLKIKAERLHVEHNTGKVRGLIVTVKGSQTDGWKNSSGEYYDFASRFFGPWTGTVEDPVTGSAHTVLAPYWSTVLDKTRFLARQCSSRGGDLLVTLRGDRVDVAGRDAVVLRGTINI